MPDVKVAPASIRIFLATGVPEGLRRVEKSNWNGVALMCSRTEYPEVRTRDEFLSPAVYLLLGRSDLSGKEIVYIGETETPRPRIDSHLKSKEFWTSLVLFGSKDDSLNKAHIRWLEARLVELAKTSGRAQIENTGGTQTPSLSEADRADAELFLSEMLVIYPVLGVRAFEPAPKVQPAGQDLVLSGPSAKGKGRETAEGFMVLAGSIARKETVPSIHNYMVVLRNQLLEDGVISDTPEGLRFDSDYVFSAPSTAAGVLLGRTAAGPVEWKTPAGVTLKQLQEESVDSGAQPSPEA